MPTTLRILSYNILEGGRGEHFDQVVEVIAATGADIVCLQECNGWPADGQALLRRAAERLGVAGWLCHSRSNYHLAVLTGLVADRFVCWRDGMNHSFGEVELRLSARRRLNLFNAHLDPHREETRLLELGLLLGRMWPKREALTLLVGDLNSLAPGDFYRGAPLATFHETNPDNTEVLQTEVQERLRAAGWTDCYRTLHDDAGYTFSANGPFCRIDYAYASPPLAAHLTGCEVVGHPLTGEASDHLPLLTTFELPDE